MIELLLDNSSLIIGTTLVISSMMSASSNRGENRQINLTNDKCWKGEHHGVEKITERSFNIKNQ
jgi:hypothetical protein